MTGSGTAAGLPAGADRLHVGTGSRGVLGLDVEVGALGVAEIGRMDFRTSRSGETATASLLRSLGLQYRYQPARLAIGRSLGLSAPPPPVENMDGKAIRGETLFGQGPAELGLWVGLVEERAGSPLGRRALLDAVAAHWARGAGLLWDALRSADDPLLALADQAVAR